MFIKEDLTAAIQKLENLHHTYSSFLLLWLNMVREDISEIVLTKNVPDLTKERWNELNQELSNLTKDLHHRLATNEVRSDLAIEEFSQVLHNYLLSKEEFIHKSPKMFQHKPSKTLENARKEKNQLRKKMKSKNATLEDVQNFNQSLKVCNFLLKTSKDN